MDYGSPGLRDYSKGDGGIMAFLLSGQTIQDPADFIPTDIIIGEQDTASDGSLKTDVIAVKTEWTLSWSHLLSAEYAVIRTLFRARNEVTFQYPDDNNVQTSAQVIIMALRPGRRKMNTYYEGVKMVLREV